MEKVQKCEVQEQSLRVLSENKAEENVMMYLILASICGHMEIYRFLIRVLYCSHIGHN
jgi:hypothetical protein